MLRCTEVGLRAPHETVGGLRVARRSSYRIETTVKEGLPVQALKALARSIHDGSSRNREVA